MHRQLDSHCRTRGGPSKRFMDEEEVTVVDAKGEVRRRKMTHWVSNLLPVVWFLRVLRLTVGKRSADASLSSPPGRENFNEKVSQAASHGFVGCLSAVQFNHVAPLKAALMNRGSSLVTIRGPLVQSNCGALAESTSHTLQGRSW